MNLINVGILAHVDAGKTTTVEQMLYKYGGLRALGSVDKGSTQTDFLPIERQRGISVATASVSIDLYKQATEPLSEGSWSHSRCSGGACPCEAGCVKRKAARPASNACKRVVGAAPLLK